MQEIQLNIIPFSPTVTKLEVGLFKEKTEGYASLHKGEYPKELWEQYERIIKDDGCILLFASNPFASALVMSNPKLFRYEFYKNYWSYRYKW